MVEQCRVISLYDSDFELPDRLSSNEWQLAEKLVSLLEPMQQITKELSARGAVISEAIPFLEILKTELGEESNDTQEKFRGILSTKDELIESLDSHFNHVYKEDKYIIATLLDPRFKGSFYDTTTSRLAVERLIATCQREPTSVFNLNLSYKLANVIYWSSLVLQTQVTHPQRRKDSIFMIPIKKQLKKLKKLPVQLQVPLLQSTLRKVCQLW